MNFKMGIYKFFSLNSIKFKDANINSSLQNQKKIFDCETSFLNWFSGLTDAEGNFLISLELDFIRFRFKILMHIDNLKALNNIKSKLNVGKVIVEKNKNRCSFVVQSFTEIRDVICPIFVQYPLLTSKNLDFQDFHKAVLIKNKNQLSLTDKNKIILLKNGMNSKREIFTSFSLNSQINVNPD